MQDRWFNSVRYEFGRATRAFTGRPTTYVEIGCWEGASAHFMLDNVLTHPQSVGVGIDPYEAEATKSRTHRTQPEVDAVFAAAQQRLATYEQLGKWRWARGRSQDVLRRLKVGAIDVLYIDGQHDGHAVVLDFALAWRYLKPGSVVIFDDYHIGTRKPPPHVPAAVDAIKLAWGDLLVFDPPGRQAVCRVVKKDR